MDDPALAAVDARTDAYLRTRDARLLHDEQAAREADALVRAALPALSPHGLGRPPCDAARVLAWFHYARFVETQERGELADLGLALFLFAANGSVDDVPAPLAVLVGPEPDADAQEHWANELVAFGRARADRYAIAAAITLLDRRQAATEDPVARGLSLADLGHARHALFDQTGLDADLDASIATGRRALEAFPADDPYRAAPLLNLGGAYLDRFGRSGDVGDLERSVDHSDRAVRALPETNPHRAIPLSTAGRGYRLLFEHTDEVAHVDAAVDRAERAVAATPAGHRELSVRRSNLARCLLVRHDRLGRPGDLEAGIASAQEALAEAGDDGQRALCHTDLAAAHRRRFDRTGDPAELDEAIALGERARRARPDDSVLLGDLAAAREERFALTGDPGDVDAALAYAEHALSRSLDPADRALRLSNLAVVRQTRYRVLGEVRDLDAAVEDGRRAVDASPEAVPAGYLANLVSALLLRFDRLADAADVDAAVEAGLRSVAGGHEHPDRPQCLSNLGAAYSARHGLTGDPSDRQAASDLAEQALAATPDDAPARPGRLWNVALGHAAAFRRSGDPETLTSALAYGERAVAAAPRDHLDRAMYLSELGDMYRERFVEGGRLDASDLDAAVEHGERAVAATVPGAPRRSRHLTRLGASYASRSRVSGAPADLAAAVETSERALALTPPGDPFRAEVLADLAYAHVLGLERDATGDRRGRTLSLAEQATGLQASPPMNRVRAARLVGRALTLCGAHDDAARLYQTAVEGLRLVAPRELTRAEQEARLGGHTGLVGEAVAAQLALGDHAGAVEVAESGRGVLLAAALDTRTEVSELDERCPELAAELHALRVALGAVDDRAGEPAGDGARRRELAARWTGLLTRIRSRPGFERFLEPPRFAELARAAGDGAVVLVNVAPSRSDAVVLRGAEVLVVPLPRLTFDAMREHGEALLGATRAGSLAGPLARGRAVPAVLAWLWDAVAGPVLDALGHRGPPEGDRPWPRVWWVPIGGIGLFPLHAAGRPGGPAVIDRVVSSYAPTIRGLLHSRSRPPARARRQLTVATSRAAGREGLQELHGTVGEARALHHDGPGGCLLLEDDATTAAVAEALAHATWAHLACHATTDRAAPSRGGLLLHDATLTISRIGAVRPESAELAYLSACSTAYAGGRAGDEAVHVASAFGLAGYRHVVATLWPVDDAVAARAARRFYDRLPASPSADAAPHALHALARDLRGEHPDRPDLWAPFIHCGP